jgi:proteasome lid subunit RPN8/RPN11
MRPSLELDDIELGIVLRPPLQYEMIAHCLREFPYEGCGLLVGDFADHTVHSVVTAENVEHSSRLYAVDPRAVMRADRAAEAAGLTIVGVFHSHTHTDPYPSPTDVAQAPDPSWHYVIVSLRNELPSIRSFRVVAGTVTEEPIVEL